MPFPPERGFSLHPCSRCPFGDLPAPSLLHWPFLDPTPFPLHCIPLGTKGPSASGHPTAPMGTKHPAWCLLDPACAPVPLTFHSSFQMRCHPLPIPRVQGILGGADQVVGGGSRNVVWWLRARRGSVPAPQPMLCPGGKPALTGYPCATVPLWGSLGGLHGRS